MEKIKFHNDFSPYILTSFYCCFHLNNYFTFQKPGARVAIDTGGRIFIDVNNSPSVAGIAIQAKMFKNEKN